MFENRSVDNVLGALLWPGHDSSRGGVPPRWSNKKRKIPSPMKSGVTAIDEPPGKIVLGSIVIWDQAQQLLPSCAKDEREEL